MEHLLLEEGKMGFGMSLASNKEYFLNNKTAFIADKSTRGFLLIPATAYVNGFDRVVEFANRDEAVSWFSNYLN